MRIEDGQKGEGYVIKIDSLDSFVKKGFKTENAEPCQMYSFAPN